MNGGTEIVRPVSSFAGFITALAVAFCTVGSVSVTTRSIVSGSTTADRFVLVKFHFHRSVWNQIIDGVAENVVGELNLLVGSGVHEVMRVTFAIEIFVLDFIEDRAIQKFLGAEAVIHDRARTEIAHLRGHGPALVAGRAVINAMHRVEFAFVADHHSRT